MSREIKFRGWSFAENRWVYGNLVKAGNNAYVVYDATDDDYRYAFENVFIPVDPKSVSYITGALDKNGNDVFFDDIVNDFNGGVWVEASEFAVNKDGSFGSDSERDPNKYIQTGDRTRLGLVIREDGTTRIKTNTMSYSYNLSKAAMLCDMEVVGNLYQNPELLKGEEQNG